MTRHGIKVTFQYLKKFNQAPCYILLFLIITAGDFILFRSSAIFAGDNSNKSLRFNSLLKKAEGHYFNKKYYTALRLLKRYIDYDPENHKAYSYLGDIYLQIRKLDKAEESFRIASELTETPDREFYRIGQVLFLKKQGKKSLQAFQKAYKLNPAMSICYFQIGMVYLQLLRNKEQTIHYWSTFRQIAPDDPQGPEIDRALAILRQKDFRLPTAGKKIPDILIPIGSESRVPYKKSGPEKEKINNKSEDIIEIDDL